MKNPTADEIDTRLIQARYAAGLGAYPSSKAHTAALSAELRRLGIPHSPAQYDKAGDCLTCGEAGRCPGVHTFEEIQNAARVEAEATRHPVTGWPAYSPSESALNDMKHKIETQKGNTP